MVSENQGTKTSVDELTKLLTARQQEIDELEEKGKAMREIVKEKDSALELARNEIVEKNQAIVELNQNIEQLTKNLAEQKVLTEAHELKEKELDLLASKLVNDVAESNTELDYLYDKISNF